MKCYLIIHPEVENDTLLAYNWYESKSPGLGDEFLRVFYSRLSSLFIILLKKNKLLFLDSSILNIEKFNYTDKHI